MEARDLVFVCRIVAIRPSSGGVFERGLIDVHRRSSSGEGVLPALNVELLGEDGANSVELWLMKLLFSKGNKPVGCVWTQPPVRAAEGQLHS